MEGSINYLKKRGFDNKNVSVNVGVFAWMFPLVKPEYTHKYQFKEELLIVGWVERIPPRP